MILMDFLLRFFAVVVGDFNAQSGEKREQRIIEKENNKRKIKEMHVWM